VRERAANGRAFFGSRVPPAHGQMLAMTIARDLGPDDFGKFGPFAIRSRREWSVSALHPCGYFRVCGARAEAPPTATIFAERIAQELILATVSPAAAPRRLNIR